MRNRFIWGWLAVAAAASGANIVMAAAWLETTFAGVPLVIFPIAGFLGVAVVLKWPLPGWLLIIAGWTLTLFILAWFLAALRHGATTGLGILVSLIAAAAAQAWGAEKIEGSLREPTRMSE